MRLARPLSAIFTVSEQRLKNSAFGRSATSLIDDCRIALAVWFLGTGGPGPAAKVKAEPAMLRIAGLSAGTSAADVRALFSKYYNTVKDVNTSGDSAGRALVLFGNAAERDKALIELQGSTLKGAKMQLTKHQSANAAARKRNRDGAGLNRTCVVFRV